MTSREILLRAIEQRDPPRMPIHYCNRDLDYSDVATAGAAPASDFAPGKPGQTEWGYVWHSLDDTMGQPEARPVDLERIDDYVPPDPYAQGRFDFAEEWTRENARRFRRFSLGISGFNQATFLCGFSELLMALYTDRALAERMVDFVFDYENVLIEQAGKFDFDCVGFGDDWGTQQGLMISPELWRQVFKPRYARQFELAHQAGMKVWFHTCGNVWSIIPDLIEIGADVLELLQPDVFGLDRLADEFAGRVCFCCSVDHQRTALTGGRDELFDYVRRLYQRLGCAGGSYRGGYIAYIEDYSNMGMTEQNYQWIRQAFHTLNDDWPPVRR